MRVDRGGCEWQTESGSSTSTDRAARRWIGVFDTLCFSVCRELVLVSQAFIFTFICVVRWAHNHAPYVSGETLIPSMFISQRSPLWYP